MCGIFGIINFDGKPVDKERVLSARDFISHRGPDDSGIYYSQCHSDPVLMGEESHSVAFAHRRLSIIDLSPAAHQPMVSDDGRYVIVFNGEIYNYEELRKEVDSRQSAVVNKFKSNSDTEVILKLFALEGPECLNKLRGMFAFAIWDDKKKKLFAARDRFGIKPFYYLHNDKEFIISSELKAIKHYKNGLTLSMQGMDAFLRTGSVPAPLTIYEETKALLPGYWLEIQSKSMSKCKIQIKQYWSFIDLFEGYEDNGFQTSCLPDRQGRNDKTSWNHSQKKYDDEAKRIIRDSLLDTISAHMVADVEIGAFLSGGIDSTAIISLMRQAGHEKIKTISVTFPGFVYDEAEFSNVAAQAFGTDHYEYRLQEHEIIDELENIFKIMDQPTVNGINTYFVAKAAKSFGLKVVLSGLGGDELFGGYPSFYKIPKYKRIANLPFAPMLMKAAIPFVKNRLPAKAVQFMKEPERVNAEYILMRGLFTDDELKEIGWNYSFVHPFERSDFRQSVSQQRNDGFPGSGNDRESGIIPVKFRKGMSSESENYYLNPLQHVSCLESTYYMRNQLLRDADVFSMAHSLELRVPFVDHFLYDAVLPYLDSSFDRKYPKKMLIDAVGDLPDEIVHRPKQGFTFPFAYWMKHGKVKEAINDLVIKGNLLFNQRVTNDLFKQFMEGKIHWSRVWAVFVVNRFGQL